MFGYVRPDLSTLDEEKKARYRAWYCGLCHALGEQHGFRGRLTLTYDMTFLAMFLSALYEPEETAGEARCVPHPVKPHAFVRSPYSDYAADMTIALAYFKGKDDWDDDRSLKGGAMKTLLQNRYRVVRERWPRQCGQIEASLKELAQTEAMKDPSPDRAANAFGTLMGAVFAREEDFWSGALRRFGASLGRFVYLSDAACDLDADRESGSYNPVLLMNRTAEDMREVLTFLLGEAAEAFEALPILRDAEILRNILYAGVWQGYNESLIKKEKRAEKKGG